MSKNKDIKIRFGVLDAVIIIVVLAIAASLVFRYTVDNSLFVYDTEKYVVTFKTCGVRYTSVDAIASAQNFYLNNGELLGRSIHAPTVTPMLTYVTSSSGELVACYYPDNTFVDIVVEIECELINKDGMIMTESGVHIAPGVELDIHTNTADLTVEIVKVQNQIAE